MSATVVEFCGPVAIYTPLRVGDLRGAYARCRRTEQKPNSVSAMASDCGLHGASEVGILQCQPDQPMDPTIPKPQSLWDRHAIDPRYSTDPTLEVAPRHIVQTQARVTGLSGLPKCCIAVPRGMHDR